MLMARRMPIGEKGAAAVLVALVMVLLMGIAAVAIDLSFGFNERRQSQTAADMAVMAGATEKLLGGDQQMVVNQVLDLARVNLNASFTDDEWRELWQSCSDPDRLGFDVGTGVPVDFQPLPEPSSWGSGELDCISEVASYLRVRVPDQIVDTTFGRVIGFNSLSASAAAVAIFEEGGELGAVLPFGIPGGTADGAVCLSSAADGKAYPPCAGSDQGAFGTINSEFFGDFFGTPACSNPGASELEQNIALGIDHAIAAWPASAAAFHGVPTPTQDHAAKNPGDNVVRDYHEIGFDDCSLDSGAVVPRYPGHVSPPNTMRVDTGFPESEIENGLISNKTFLGERSRLQQGGGPTRRIVKKKTGGINTVNYDLDNQGPWDYLNAVNAIPGAPECNGNSYSGMETLDKAERFDICLQKYGSSTTVLFSASIADSPRLVWAPEFWFSAETSGLSWQPVYRFRLVFIAGVYFNCTPPGNSEPSPDDCEAIFYPDSSVASEICVPSGMNHCKELSVSQLSGFLLPGDAVPQAAIPPFPGADTAFGATLFR